MTDETTPTLNPRQERFCLEYLKDLNATQAYIRAGYAAKDADVAGPRLLGHVGVKARVAALKDEQFKALHMSANEVLSIIATVARFNIGNITFVTDDGDPYIDLTKATPQDMAALGALEIEDFVDRRERDDEGNVIARDVRRVKVKALDKIKAAELLMKHHGLLTEKVEITVKDDLAMALAEGRRRARERQA